MIPITLESRTINTHDCVVWLTTLAGFREKNNYQPNRADKHYGTSS